MKRILRLLLLTIITFSSSAQKQANVWYLGYGAGVNFNSGSPVALSNGALYTSEGCASIADKNTGQILFYTDGIYVYNRNHFQMSNGSGLKGDISSTQSAVIVPKPGSNTLYYIFTQDAQAGFFSGNAGALCYSVVDMSLNGGQGDVTIKNQLLKNNMTEKIAAVKACNGRDIWVAGHEWNSNAFYAFLVTPTGVSAPVISNTGVTHQDLGSGNNAETIGYMKFSPDGKKIVTACYEELNTIQVFDFNNATGVVSNPITDTNFPNISGFDGPYGATFSPDNSRLYISYFAVSPTPSQVYQYNMLAGSGAAIIASRTLISSSFSGFYAAMQIGPDGKIYSCHGNTSYLDVINNPNALGTACNYVTDAVSLTGTVYFGLPDMVESSLFPTPPFTATLTYTGCGSNTAVAFVDSNLNGVLTCLWDFGDPASGTADSSTLQNPSHTFSSSGTFTVKLYLTNACTADTLTKTITVASTGTNATATPSDTAFCEGGFVQLMAAGGATYKWAPATGLSDPNIANPVAYPSVSTTYTVTVSPMACGDSTATVDITVYPSPSIPSITQAHDTLTFGTDTSYISFQWYFNNQPIPGATGISFIAGQDGNYNVAVTNRFGCTISVGINIVLGLEDYFAEGSVYLSPNPASNELTIHADFFHDGEEVTISLLNVLGEVLKTETGHRQKETLDVSHLSSGIYFVQVTAAGRRWAGRFVKE